MRQVTIAEYGTFFALKNGSDTLATSPIKEPLEALARVYNHADKLAEAIAKIRTAIDRGLNLTPSIYGAINTLKAYEEAQSCEQGSTRKH